MAVCSICTHRDAKQINNLLLEKGGRRTGVVMALAAQFGISRQSVWRHRKLHLGVGIPKARPGTTLEARCADLARDAMRLQLLAENGADIGEALRALKERRSLMTLEARLSGKLQSESAKVLIENTINVPQNEATAEEAVREYLEVCGPRLLPADEGNEQ